MNKTSVTLNDFIDQITLKVNSSWDTLKKVRYVYIELGEYLNNNVDFLNTIISNLNDQFKSNSFNYLSRISTILLNKCLNKLDIENSIIYLNDLSNYKDISLKSDTVLNIKISDNDSIFVSLFDDLSNIKDLCKTNYFGFVLNYYLFDELGNEFISYKGVQIKDLSEVKKDILIKIDKELGYDFKDKNNDNYKKTIDENYLNSIKDKFIDNKLYLELLAKDTDYFKNVFGSSMFDYFIDDVNKISKIPYESCKYISRILNYNFSDIKIDNFNYDNWYSSVKSYSNSNILEEHDSFIRNIYNLIRIMSHHTLNNKEKIKYIDSFNNKILSLCSLFIDKDYLPNSGNNIINGKYISKKFYLLFDYILDCNEEVSYFNKLSHLEQTDFIIKILKLIFSDDSDIFDIIKIYTYRMLNDGSYELIFEINNYDLKDYYSYNLTSNKFKKINKDRFEYINSRNIINNNEIR